MANDTKLALMASMLRLLEQMPFDKITIRLLVEDCHVNRNTFYYHFHDIYNLLEQLLEEEVRKILEQSQKDGNWDHTLTRYFRFIQEHKKVLYHLYHSSAEEYLKKYLLRVLDIYISGYLKKEASEFDISEEDRDFMSRFYRYAMRGMMREWMEQGMEQDLFRYMQKLSRFFEENLHYILARYERQSENDSAKDPPQ